MRMTTSAMLRKVDDTGCHQLSNFTPGIFWTIMPTNNEKQMLTVIYILVLQPIMPPPPPLEAVGTNCIIYILPIISIPRSGGSRRRENTQPKNMANITNIISQKMVPLGGVAIFPNIAVHDPQKLNTNIVYVSKIPIFPCGGQRKAYLNFSTVLGL